MNQTHIKLETLIGNLNGFVYRCKYDKNWTMEYLSEGCLKITGYSPEELIENKVISFNDLIVAEYREFLWNLWKENFSKKEHVIVEYPIITKNGEIKWVWEQSCGVFNENNELVALEGYITDITFQKNAEIKLHGSNLILKLLADKTKDLIYRYKFKPHPQFVYVSPSSTEITGYTPDEHYADPFLGMKIVHPEDKNILESIFQANFDFNKPLIIRWIKKNGEIIWTEQKNVPIYNSFGEIIAIEGIARNITAEKQREEFDKFLNEYSTELISLELDKIFEFITNKLTRFLNSSAIFIFLYDEITKKLILKKSSVNKINFTKILKLLGKQSKKEISFKLDELTYNQIAEEKIIQKKSLYDLTFGQIPKILAKSIQKLLNINYLNGISLSKNNNLLGTIIIACNENTKELNLTYLKTLGGITTNAFIRYLNEIKLQKLEIAIEQNPASIVITDTNGLIEYINPQFTQITEYTYDEVIGKNPKILKSGEHDKIFYKNLWNTISSGKVWTGEFLNKKKSGELYWEYARIAPIKNNKGKIINYVAIKEDITELKQKNDLLLASMESYQSVFNSVTDAIFIHDKNSVFIEVNKRAETMFGYSKKELIGKNPKFVGVNDMNNYVKIFKIVQNVFQTGIPTTIEF
ncbi:MAG TPA: PAS domain S-box protein [Bacteroidales bacterium]|nr:PAS domain S-box protein [Bacteroidales bacterium]HOL98804.1 PAS domain S-box protein [Bacteroidales bacterium]HOM37034.1 PAS domain S-box protein [Bacteroidales bacterium]HPD24659.1 PAS domain S-box protein [Bacteroidales bacterium]HRT00404.1 PAS domain S-box protein [Bacteroidales bacterium]